MYKLLWIPGGFYVYWASNREVMIFHSYEAAKKELELYVQKDKQLEYEIIEIEDKSV